MNNNVFKKLLSVILVLAMVMPYAATVFATEWSETNPQPKTVLSVSSVNSADLTALKTGDKVKVEVKADNLVSSWISCEISLKYNSDAFKLSASNYKTAMGKTSIKNDAVFPILNEAGVTPTVNDNAADGSFIARSAWTELSLEDDKFTDNTYTTLINGITIASLEFEVIDNASAGNKTFELVDFEYGFNTQSGYPKVDETTDTVGTHSASVTVIAANVLVFDLGSNPTVAVPTASEYNASQTGANIGINNIKLIDNNYTAVTDGLDKITWEIKDANSATVTSGLTVSGGKIIADNTASAGSYTLTAKAAKTDFSTLGKDVTSVSVAFTVTKAEAQPQTLYQVEIEKDANTFVPILGAGDNAVQFSAVVKDQFGDNYNGATVTWSIDKVGDKAPSGVSIDSSGKVTITAAAIDNAFTNNECALTVRASYQSAEKTATLTVKRSNSVVTSAVIAADPASASVPAKGSDPATVTPTLTVSDQYGKTMSKTATWSITEVAPSQTVKGITVNTSTGVVSVDNTASQNTFNSGSLTVKIKAAVAKSESETVDSNELSLTVSCAAAVLDSVEVSGGQSTIAVPTVAANENGVETSAFTAKAFDQFGNEISGAQFTFKVYNGETELTSDKGISITSDNKVKVMPSAANENTFTDGSLALTVKASCTVASVTKTGEKSLAVTRNASSVASVTVSGDVLTAAVPTAAAQNDVELTFTAGVKDQYGANNSSAVSWSLTQGIKGVTVSNGVVTVGKEAIDNTFTSNSYSFTVTATCSGKSDNKTVTLTRSNSVVTSITVSVDNDTPSVPEKNSKTVVTPSASVYDQYARVMNGETVVWSIPTINGAKIENNKVVIDSTASTFNQFVSNQLAFDITATSSSKGSVTGTKSVTLSRAADVVTSVEIDYEGEVGSKKSTLNVPVLNSTDTAAPVVTVYNQYGIAMSGQTVAIEKVGSLPNGVSISDGVITVTPSASVNNTFNADGNLSFKVKATVSGKVSNELSYTLHRDAPAVTVVTAEIAQQNATKAVPTTGTEEFAPTVKYYDQYGNEMSGKTVTLSIVDSVVANSITADNTNGKIKVVPSASTNTFDKNNSFTFKIKATVDGVDSNELSLTVTRVAAAVTSISISGGQASINVPVLAGHENGEKTSAFTVKAFDQYGNEMSGVTGFVWSLTGTKNNGLSVTDDHKLLVMPSAADNDDFNYQGQSTTGTKTVHIKVAVNSVEAIKDVTLSREKSVATSLGISGGATSIEVPANGADANTTPAFAVGTTDQYGIVMSGMTGSWSIKNGQNTVNGITISDAGVVTVTNAAKSTVLNTTGIEMTVTAAVQQETKTATITVKRAESVAQQFSITGAQDIIVPAVGASNATLTLSASPVDQYGASMSVDNIVITCDSQDVTSSLPTGISFDSANYKFTVTSAASAAIENTTGKTYTVKMSVGSVYAQTNVTIKRAESVTQEFSITGAQDIIVPAIGASDDTLTLSASPVDQYGESKTIDGIVILCDSEDVTSNLPMGISFDSANYKFTVTSAASAAIENTTGKTYTVKLSVGSVYAQTNVTIKRAASTVTSVTITEPQSGSITVPTDNTNAELQLAATVKDQYGETLSENITWSVNPSVASGITFANGKFTVTKNAKGVGAGVEYTVTAAVGQVSDTQTVTVSCAESVLTTLKIMKGGDEASNETVIAPIHSGDSAKILNYSVVSLDQYGNNFAGTTLTLNGNSCNGTVSIPYGATAGEMTLTAANGETSKSITINVKVFTPDWAKTRYSQDSTKITCATLAKIDDNDTIGTTFGYTLAPDTDALSLTGKYTKVSNANGTITVTFTANNSGNGEFNGLVMSETYSITHVNTQQNAQQDATCIAVGYTAGVYCNDCQTYLSGHEEIAIDPTNHVHTSTINANAATAQAYGYTGDTYCSDCQQTVAYGYTVDFAGKRVATISGVTAASDLVYSGEAVTAYTGTLTVGNLFDDIALEASDIAVHYTGTGSTSYDSDIAPTDAGSYKVTFAVPDSNTTYSGKLELTFYIAKKDIANCDIKVPDSFYTGGVRTPEPVVTNGNVTAVKGTDFSVGYDKNLQIGQATATLTAMGNNYTGSKSVNFQIKSVDAIEEMVSFDQNENVTAGQAPSDVILVIGHGTDIKIEDVNEIELDGNILVKDRDFELRQGSIIVVLKKSVVDTLGIGAHKIDVSLKGAFAGLTVSASVKINAAPSQVIGRANPKTGAETAEISVPSIAETVYFDDKNRTAVR